MGLPKIPREIVCKAVAAKGEYPPKEETPVTLDEPVALVAH